MVRTIALGDRVEINLHSCALKTIYIEIIADIAFKINLS